MWDTRIIIYYYALQPTSTMTHSIDTDLMVDLFILATSLIYQLF